MPIRLPALPTPRPAAASALWALALFVLAAPMCAAATYYVSPFGNDNNPGTSWAASKQHVQAGINAASPGDQVWVAQGTYPENITAVDGEAVYGGFAGTETSLTQRNIAANPTILDGGNNGTVYTVPNSATGANTFDGFTVQHGNSYYGGGLNDSSGDTLIVANSTFTDNTAGEGGGGMVFGSATIVNCTFTNNSAGGYGGGISFGGPSTIMNCTFTDNTSAHDGGGADGVGSAMIVGCTFTGNTAADNGGGIFDNADFTILRCTLSGNTPCAVYSFNTSSGYPLIIEDSLVIGTGTTATSADGIDLFIRGNATNSNATITNNTIVNTNVGININTSSGAVNVANNILYANNGGLSDGGGVTLTSSHNDIFGNVSYAYAGVALDPSDLTTDPLFVSAGSGDYHLSSGSPLIGAGNGGYVASGDKDLDGRLRPNPPSIGAYELAHTLTVAADGGGQYPTIQAAINAALSGDTVLLSDGTYSGPGNVDLDFGGRNITVTSVNGAATTIINCEGSSSADHRGFYLHSGETNAVIRGLTIENGYESSSDGGGIYNSGGGMTVRRCVLQNNFAGANPGGGGGIANVGGSSSISVTGCTLSGNSAYNNGGGIFDDNEGSGTIAVTKCILSGNSAGNGGGGIFSKNLSVGAISVTRCTLSGNSAAHGGGFGGGGLYVSARSSGPISVTDCALSGNTSGTYGGGLYSDARSSGATVVTNCTLTGNTAPANNGGGLYSSSNGPITLINDILYGDTGGELDSANITVTDSDIQGGYAGTGNIAADPLFVNAPADLHLQSGSPCLGAGTANGAPTTTLDGYVRPTPPSIGAYELSIAQHISPQYVSPSGSDGDPGTQAAPKLTIQAAINATFSGDTVIVEDGTYSGPGDVDLDFGGRNITVMSVNGAVSTVINCGGSSSASHRGFYLHSGETNAVISGLTIENGYESSDSGGGIDNVNVGVTVQNCLLKNDFAGGGGGINNRNQGNGTMSIINCTLTANTVSNGSGGGLVNENDGSGIINVTACTITNNTATDEGGIFNNNQGGGTIRVANCMLTGNSAQYNSGGIANNNGGSGGISIAKCTLTGNSASSGGGIYNILNYNSSGTISVINCTLTGNTGGGLYNENDGSGTISVTNAILYGDTGGEVGGAVAAVSYCDVQGGYAGAGNFDANPLLAPLGSYGGPTQTLALLPGSPCLGAGTNAGVAYDQRGVAIPQAGRYDIGAFESQGFTLAVTGGNNQTATLGTAFSVPLAVTVTANDPAGLEPVIGGQITFTAPASGPSAGLTGSPATIGTGGAASVTATANTLAGSYSVIPSAAGTATGTGTGSAAFSLTNGYGPTQTTLTSSLNPAPAGQSVTFTASVSGAAGTPTGSVTFSVDGAAQTPVSVDGSGHAALTTSSLAVGSHSISATYGGDATFAPSSTASPLTQTITALTTLTVANATGSAGQTVTLSATLKKTGGAGVAGETVSFAVDGTAVGTAVTTSSGAAGLHYVVPASLTVGGHTLTASFVGDSGDAASSGTGTLTVSKSNTVVTVGARSGAHGTTVSLKAYLKTSVGAILSGATLTYTVNGAAAGSAVTDSTGLASLNYAIPASAPAGNEPIVISFAGDSGDNPSTGNGTLTVTGSALSTSVTVAAVSGAPGQTVSLSATLKAGTTPLGGKTLTFKVDGVTVGTAVTNSSGVASLSYAIPANANLGSHTVAVSFAGDSGDAASSGMGTLTVTGASKLNTVVTVGTRLGKAGTTVVLKSYLKTSAGAVLVGKTLTYTVNGGAAGTAVTDSTGLASLTYAIPVSAPAGNEPIVVSFAGDSGDYASTGKGTLTVN